MMIKARVEEAETCVDGISIVTTTWNEKESIERLICLARSVLRNVHHEIIVVDDDSPDDTVEIARKFADKTVKKQRRAEQRTASRNEASELRSHNHNRR